MDFTKASIKDLKDPKLLYMKPCHIYTDGSQFFTEQINGTSTPVQAKHANKWIVKRQTTIEAPNLFCDKRFYLVRKINRYSATRNL